MSLLGGLLLGGILDGASGDDSILDGALLGGIVGSLLGSSSEDEATFHCKCGAALRSLTCHRCGREYEFTK